jgi:hypothetical protein
MVAVFKDMSRKDVRRTNVIIAMNYLLNVNVAVLTIQQKDKEEKILANVQIAIPLIAFVNVNTVGKTNVFVRARIVIENRVSVLVQTVAKIRVNVYVRNVEV